MTSYLTNTLQRCKINNSFSEWAKIYAGVSQESILGPLLFNIFINDMFLFLQKCDITNYAGDRTIYTSDKHVSTIVDSLRHDFCLNGLTITSWFVTQKNVYLCC